MNGSYWVGVVAAIVAGMAFNLGMLIQKQAVMNTNGRTGLMVQLIRSPLWLIGFALQFIIGMPMNMLAQANIGPTIIPGLMAIGLIVLAIGAVLLAGERFRFSDMVGVSFVIVAVTIFGLSRLSVDMRSIDLYEPAFLIRLGCFTIGAAVLSLICLVQQKVKVHLRGILIMLNAGLLLSQSNLWLGILMSFLAKWGAGAFSAYDLLSTVVASGIVFAGSMLGIAQTQLAFRFGEASKLIPIQYVPSQILPIAAYFMIFNLRSATPAALPLACAGIAFVLSGAILLAKRQIFNKEGVAND